jgi:hypothetical protein
MPTADAVDLDQLAAALVDQGLLIEAGFVSLCLCVIPADAPGEQVRDMKLAFFAGAQHLFSSLIRTLDPGAGVTRRDLDRVRNIEAELQRFADDLRARNLLNMPTVGNA